MAINGPPKIFSRNESLSSDGASAVASSGTGVEDNALDRNRFSYWRSVGSDDTTTETFTVTLPDTVTFDRILLVDHNFKDFDIMYDDSGFVNFSNTEGLDGSVVGGIIETTFADGTAYYEFDAVTTDTIRIRCTKTQVVDAQKFLNQLIVCTELGTFTGYPKINAVNWSRNTRSRKVLSGKSLIQKSQESRKLTMQFQNYPTGGDFESDSTLVETLFDREVDFLLWLCGGKRGTTDFGKRAMRGWRLEDVIPMQIDRDISWGYKDNVYNNPVNFRVSLVEHA